MSATKYSEGVGNRSRSVPDTDDGERSTSVIHQKRTATVYDAVAGRIGLNGFLTPSQLASTELIPSAPEEVLLRRVSAPETIPYDFYDADKRLEEGEVLPESDLLKAIHAYSSDFYSAATHDQGQHDFRSLDETALLALGVLLEEAAREVLGENGDMVLVEPEGLENGLPETRMTRHQIKGAVKPPPTPEYISEASEEDEEESDEEGKRAKTRRLQSGDRRFVALPEVD